MKLPHLLFLNLVLLCLLMAWSWTRPQVGSASGTAHPVIEHMLVGGNGAERFAPVAVESLLYGCLSIIFFIGLLALGLRQRGRIRGNKLALLTGLAIYLFMFVSLWSSYRVFANHQSGVEAGGVIGPLFLGFPMPTAWMLFGLYAAPLFFAVLYYVKFDSWVYTAEDQAAFHKLVEAANKARQAEGS